MKRKNNSVKDENIIALRKARTKELLCIWSFLIIPLINLCIFWVYGTIQSFPIAFEHKFTNGKTTYDFSNFRYIIKTLSEPDGVFGQAIVNTLIYWLLGFCVMMPLGLLMAFSFIKRYSDLSFSDLYSFFRLSYRAL